jgi:hypothetical protein
VKEDVVAWDSEKFDVEAAETLNFSQTEEVLAEEVDMSSVVQKASAQCIWILR